MTEIPLISITQDDNFNDDIDDDTPRPNINECLTDVEDMDTEHRNEPLLKVSFKNEDDGATDIEDWVGSEEDFEEENQIKDTEISLNEFLDQGCIDESSNVNTANNKQQLLRSQSLAKSPSPSAFNLDVSTLTAGAITDVEDMQSSGEELEENYYSNDDKPILLEDSKGTDIHDSLSSHRKVMSINRAKQASDSESDNENEKKNKKRNCKLRPKRLSVKCGNVCEEAKSDVESMFLDDDKKCKQVRKQRQFPVLDTPDIEVMAFDGSDMEENNETKIPEINILFHSQKKSSRNKATKSIPTSSSLLLLPKHSEDALTDVENLNSSDDDEDFKTGTKNLIPIAIMKSDALTDVEDMGDDSDEEEMEVEEKPEIVLPSPLREMTLLCENNEGEPNQKTIPLPDTFLLGIQSMEIEKGLTDVEDFSDEDSMEEQEVDVKEFELKNYFESEGGFQIESSDRSTIANATSSNFHQGHSESCKKMTSGLRHRKIKTKQTQPVTNLLNIDTNVDALTDVEDMNIDLADS